MYLVNNPISGQASWVQLTSLSAYSFAAVLASNIDPFLAVRSSMYNTNKSNGVFLFCVFFLFFFFFFVFFFYNIYIRRNNTWLSDFFSLLFLLLNIDRGYSIVPPEPQSGGSERVPTIYVLCKIRKLSQFCHLKIIILQTWKSVYCISKCRSD